MIMNGEQKTNVWKPGEKLNVCGKNDICHGDVWVGVLNNESERKIMVGGKKLCFFFVIICVFVQLII